MCLHVLREILSSIGKLHICCIEYKLTDAHTHEHMWIFKYKHIRCNASQIKVGEQVIACRKTEKQQQQSHKKIYTYTKAMEPLSCRSHVQK